VDGREYRFSVVQIVPRFIEITAQACPLPGSGDGSTADTAGIPELQDGEASPDFVTD
jgi:hypothetical protein